jgi:hypothetical protein
MAPPTKRDLIIFQLARITIWRQVEVGDGQLWLSSQIRSRLYLI